MAVHGRLRQIGALDAPTGNAALSAAGAHRRIKSPKKTKSPARFQAQGFPKVTTLIQQRLKLKPKTYCASIARNIHAVFS